MSPLTLPELSGNEWKYVKECPDTGWVSMAGAIPVFQITISVNPAEFILTTFVP